MTHKVNVKDLLKSLPPLVLKTMSFDDFLSELGEHTEWGDTAPGLLLRSIAELGEENLEDEEDPERKQFLQMLREMKVPSLKAFKHVAGSQRFVMRVLTWLKMAADGGAQLKKGLIVVGGPGAGKDYAKDGFINALEKGAVAYCVKGCPEHESPLNLLKLFERDRPQILKELADAVGISMEKMQVLLDFALEPCAHCYREVMGDVSAPKESPCFDEIKVEAVRITRRSIGVSEWQPGGDVSLVNALRQGQRGFISMPDAFVHREIEQGKTDERLILLDVPQYRRLPGIKKTDGEVVSFSPFDAFLFATTNEKALSDFLETLPDKDAFTGRFDIFKMPYNTVRVEEIRAYKDFLKKMKGQATFDPLVLHMVATLAVVSRFPVPAEAQPFVHPIDRLRLYQGDPINVKPRPASEHSSVWSAASGGFGSGYGNDSRGSPSSGDKGEALAAGVKLSTDLLWKTAKDEGLTGLDMRLMMGIVGSLNAFGLRGSKHKCVNAIQAILLLRQVMATKLMAPNLTPVQEKTYARCLKWLGGKASDASMSMDTSEQMAIGTDKPDLIESEYRRMLKQQILKVLEPNYEQRAQDFYEDYKLFATQWLLDKTKLVKHPKMGMVTINESLIDDLDRYRLGKRPDRTEPDPKDPKRKIFWAGDPLSDDDKKFRRSLETLIADARDAFIEEHGAEKAKDFKESWETITDLANAIRAKLDAEIAAVADKLLSSEVTSELTEDEQKKLAAAKHELEKMGYCDDLQKPVLEYAKRVKVWAHKA